MTHIHSSGVLRLTPDEFAERTNAVPPGVAVFDCDGTLWNGDAGYDFMLWSIEKGIVSRATAYWIDTRYRLYRAGKVSESDMCGEMVQIYEGLREEEVRQAGAQFFHSQIAPSIFPEMRALVAAMQRRGMTIWAVSSTNNWVIEEAMKLFEVPPERVLGTCVAVADGIITSKLLDIPSGEGKGASLRRVGLPAPEAVFGNSIHDAAMLAIAQNPFAVNPTPSLLHEAARNGWPVFYPHGVLPEAS